MVSLYPNPPLGHDFAQLHGCHNHKAGDPMNANLLENSSSWNVGFAMEDPNKKIRKPYTITKSRESWSEQEHDKFLEALHLFDRDWKKIEAFIGSKTVIQIRSHAQKYFLKVLKNGKSEHVPPPRPKRKAVHPYPQKAPNKDKSQMTGEFQSSAALLDFSMHKNPAENVPLPPWTLPDYAPHISREDIGLSGGNMMQKYSCDSNELNHQLQTSNVTDHQEKKCEEITGMPDFAQVYSFIGSIFDDSGVDHLPRLEKMDPINVWTVLMLIKNLSINLVSPEFEDQRRLLSTSAFRSGNDNASTIHFA